MRPFRRAGYRRTTSARAFRRPAGRFRSGGKRRQRCLFSFAGSKPSFGGSILLFGGSIPSFGGRKLRKECNLLEMSVG
ncbi:hypothetical protein [Alloprevotella tannerae]|uniref:hypothetical protein n=1 Tax=Alloprevotella tannerae TaxID=76122 RepID=UPI0028D54ACB|nr:hypothetical protein [Alloprevotella tannerae]